MSAIAIKSSSLGYFVFDATFRETHNFTNAITQNPVQTGAAINDHIYQQPIVLTCDVGVTDCYSPNRYFNGSSGRSLSAYGVLVKLWQSGDVMDVTTSYATYQNMVIKSFVPVREPKTMNAMRATVVFQQIIVTSAVEISVAQKNTSAPQTTGKTTSGTKSVTVSTKYKKLTIPQSLMVEATYGGKNMFLADYFDKYSSSKGSYTKGGFLGLFGDYTITPILSSAVMKGTTFSVNGKAYSYDELLSAYGK